LVYGLDVRLPIHPKLPTYSLLQDFSTGKDAVQNRINQMIELDENRRKAYDQNCKNQEKIKRAFDKSVEIMYLGRCSLLIFGYLGKRSPCAYESLSTKGEDYYPYTLLYDSNFTLT
jgi:hypothetical protein